MNIVLIDYGSGNLRSAQKAFAYMAREAGVRGSVMITKRADELCRADMIILPGVGAFADCASGVLALDGVYDALNEMVIKKARPFLGICVGMQLMAQYGEEESQNNKAPHKGFGWLKGRVSALTPDDKKLKLPHMGWNNIKLSAPHPVWQGLNNKDFYFVHSYVMRSDDAHIECMAECDYGGVFCAGVAKDNMIGTQFHPEKSQHNGLRFIENFLRWRP